MMACMDPRSPHGASRHRRPPRAATAAVLAVLIGQALTGCTESNDDPPTGNEETPLEIELATGTSGLSRQEREDVQQQVGDALSTYVVGAFLGDYPRDDFVSALPAFTSRAAEYAADDLDLLTARRYSDAEDVTAQSLVARVDVFTAARAASGASARVRFRFEANESGGSSTPFALTGRFALLPVQGEWRIFGYDVSRRDPQQGAQ